VRALGAIARRRWQSIAKMASAFVLRDSSVTRLALSVFAA